MTSCFLILVFIPVGTVVGIPVGELVGVLVGTSVGRATVRAGEPPRSMIAKLFFSLNTNKIREGRVFVNAN